MQRMVTTSMTPIEPTTIAPASFRPRPLASLLCDLLPSQGHWSDDAYLWLTDHTNRLIEFTDGHIQELPIPTSTARNEKSGARRP